MMLSSLNMVSFQDKLGTDTIKDAAKYKLSRQKFFALMQTRAATFNIDSKPFLKKLNKTKLAVTTKQLFDKVKMSEPSPPQLGPIKWKIIKHPCVVCVKEDGCKI